MKTTLNFVILLAVVTAFGYLAYLLGIEWNILRKISFITALTCLFCLPSAMEETTGALIVPTTFFACFLLGLHLIPVFLTWWNFINFAAAGFATFVSLFFWQEFPLNSNGYDRY